MPSTINSKMSMTGVAMTAAPVFVINPMIPAMIYPGIQTAATVKAYGI